MNERRTRQSVSANSTPPILLSLLGVGLLFFLFLGVKSLLNREPDVPAAVVNSSSSAVSASTGATDTTPNPGSNGSSPAESETVPASSGSTDASSAASSAASSSPASSEVPAANPPETEPAVQMVTVDDSYFSDALFVGDSRTDGLCLYSTPGACKHFCKESLTIFNIMDKEMDAYGFSNLRSLLQGMQFGKVYIMLGINECWEETGKFAAKYQSVVEEIRQYQPHALIYIQSICYVSQNVELNEPVFATANLKEKNEAIKKLANGKDIFYLEVNDCLNDGTDHLPAEYTGDGKHLTAKYYSLWHNYLLQHAVVDADHPWQAGQAAPVGAEAENP